MVNGKAGKLTKRVNKNSPMKIKFWNLTLNNNGTSTCVKLVSTYWSFMLIVSNNFSQKQTKKQTENFLKRLIYWVLISFSKI